MADVAAPVFVYSGMGPQWWRMGRDLLASDGPFARAAAEIDETVRPLSGFSLIDEMRRDEAESRVTRTEIAQPANFLVQIGLTAELARYGVHPAAVVGHSVGEVSAAYVSGMLSLADAVAVSYHRSRLQATTAGSGGMLAVGLSEADAQDMGQPGATTSASRRSTARPRSRWPAATTRSPTQRGTDQRGHLRPPVARRGALPLAPDGPDPARADARR